VTKPGGHVALYHGKQQTRPARGWAHTHRIVTLGRMGHAPRVWLRLPQASVRSEPDGLTEPLCLVCGAAPFFQGWYVPTSPELPNLHYALCADHSRLPLEEIERWIRHAVHLADDAHVLPEGFGR
jgi:hypothetical protein